MLKKILLTTLFICTLNCYASNSYKLFFTDTIVLHKLYNKGNVYLQSNKIDSAIISLKKLIELEKKEHVHYFTFGAYRLLGKCYFEKNDIAVSKQYLDTLIKEQRLVGTKEDIAESLFIYALDLFNYEPAGAISKYAIVIPKYEEALQLYKELGNKEKEADILKSLADVYLNQGKLILAEKYLKKALSIYKANNKPDLFYTYDLLSVVNRLQGNLDESLSYALAALDNIKAINYKGSVYHFYGVVADNYRELEMYNKSAHNYQIIIDSLTLTQPIDELNTYTYLFLLVEDLIYCNKLTQAEEYINKYGKRAKPLKYPSKVMFAKAKALYFKAIKKHKLAEQEFLFVKQYYDNHAKDEYPVDVSNFYRSLGQFYFSRQQYDSATFYAKKAANVPNGILSLVNKKDLEYLNFQIDSAKNNYKDALKKYQLYTTLKDSIYSLKKMVQIEQLHVAYEVNTIKNKNKQLEKTVFLEKDNLEKTKYLRNLAFIVAILLTVIVLLLLNRFYVNKKNNKILLKQKEEISEKNNLLENYLKEKDWTIKEIHHRVKNNLQIVMSLLNSQRESLNYDDLDDALKKSQYRLYAISLIHQKLYSDANGAYINFTAYIKELAIQLKESFNTTNSISFKFELDSVFLDTTIAVPLGLILNEAVTNAIKYAFNNNETGQIQVLLKKINSTTFELVIKDSGRGLPITLDPETRNSLGFQLIYGLTKQIDGLVSIESSKGVTIKVVFTIPNKSN